MTVRNSPVPAKLTTVSLINVRSCNALLRMLIICVNVYLKSFLRFKFLILYTFIRLLYLRGKGFEDPGLFLEAKWGPRAKRLGNYGLYEHNAFIFRFISLEVTSAGDKQSKNTTLSLHILS
jgi:hypothetical protein